MALREQSIRTSPPYGPQPGLVRLPPALDPAEWLHLAVNATPAQVEQALGRDSISGRDLAILLSPAAGEALPALAERARSQTLAHFGRTIQLYVPLYLSNYCPSGCAYCGYASDRDVARRRLSLAEAEAEVMALKKLGFEEILLLTGERCPEADFDYVRAAVAMAARHVHRVTIEVFPMQVKEYSALAAAGCTGVTLYQETYDPTLYNKLHRWGAKADFAWRLHAPSRALAGGLRTAGLGALLGLGDPRRELLALYRHAVMLRRRFWRAEVSLSFPRLRPECGGFQPTQSIDDHFLAQAVWAFRLALPDTTLTLSTRERAAFRDGMAGIGVNKMSVASRTTVGGYDHDAADGDAGQFSVDDDRDVPTFNAMLRSKRLEPVFKSWDAAYR